MLTKHEVFSRNLKRALKNTYMNQSQLAELCGVSRGSFNDWVNGRNYPRPEKLELLAKSLGVTEYDLTTNFDDEHLKSYLNHDVVNLANNLFDDPEAKELYQAISNLSENDRKAIKQIVYSLNRNE